MELEQQIAALLKQRDAAGEGTPGYAFAVRQLQGLYWSREGAQEILEALDPLLWGDFTGRPRKTADPEGKLLPLRRTSVSDPE